MLFALSVFRVLRPCSSAVFVGLCGGPGASGARTRARAELSVVCTLILSAAHCCRVMECGLLEPKYYYLQFAIHGTE